MDKQEQNLIALMDLAVNGRMQGVDQPDYPRLLTLARKHHVDNLLYHAVKKLPPPQQPQPQFLGALRKLAYAAAARDALQEKESAQVLAAFDGAAVRVLPLKGSCLKRVYPSPEMRHMSDTDLLIAPSQAQQAHRILEGLHFTEQHSNDESTDLYRSDSGFLLELHKSLVREGANQAGRDYLAGLMDQAQPVSEGSAVLALPHVEHYTYLICHALKHFLGGGIGIRTILDLWLCRKHWAMDDTVLQERLRQLGLEVFTARLEELGQVWFGDREADEFTDSLGDYLFGSGAYGSFSNKAENLFLGRSGGNRFAYWRGRIFPPLKVMSGYFPVLKKCPILLPAFWFLRWIQALTQRREKLKTELRTVSAADEAQALCKREFYRQCGVLSLWLNGRGGQTD